MRQPLEPLVPACWWLESSPVGHTRIFRFQSFNCCGAVVGCGFLKPIFNFERDKVSEEENVFGLKIIYVAAFKNVGLSTIFI